MCRSIKTLRTLQPPPSPEDFRAAALQFVRKISGYRQPSHANSASLSSPPSTLESPTIIL